MIITMVENDDNNECDSYDDDGCDDRCHYMLPFHHHMSLPSVNQELE